MCGDARILGSEEHERFPPKKEGVRPKRLGELRLCWMLQNWLGQLLWGWAWRSFQHSKDLLLNRSRVDVLATEELKEIHPGFL